MSGKTYDGRIPAAAWAALENAAGRNLSWGHTGPFSALEKELAGLGHGWAALTVFVGNVTARLTVRIRDGSLQLFETYRRVSPEAETQAGEILYEVERNANHVPEKPAGGAYGKK
jgi:hypothetical protein